MTIRITWLTIEYNLTNLKKKLILPDRKTELEDVLSHTFSRSIKTSLTATENKKVVDTILEHSAVGVLKGLKIMC